MPPYRRNVNTVFQHYALFPHMNVGQNVGYGLRQKKASKADEARRVGEALELVRLSGYEQRRTWELSGGQQQRVALARALVNHPTVLLLDEPLGALDRKLRHEMQIELKQLQREVGITFIYVTHDQEEALTMSDVIVVMRDGRIQQQGHPEDLYERPVNRFVAGFVGTSNFLAAKVVGIDAATGTATAETDSGLRMIGRITDPDARLAAGDEVTVAIRPEAPVVEGPEAAAPIAAGRRDDPRHGADQAGHLPRRHDRVPDRYRARRLARRPAPERPRRRRTPAIRPGRGGDAHLERRGQPGPRDLTQTQPTGAHVEETR